jgi:hypothetical protein
VALGDPVDRDRDRATEADPEDSHVRKDQQVREDPGVREGPEDREGPGDREGRNSASPVRDQTISRRATMARGREARGMRREARGGRPGLGHLARARPGHDPLVRGGHLDRAGRPARRRTGHGDLNANRSTSPHGPVTVTRTCRRGRGPAATCRAIARLPSAAHIGERHIGHQIEAARPPAVPTSVAGNQVVGAGPDHPSVPAKEHRFRTVRPPAIAPGSASGRTRSIGEGRHRPCPLRT